MLARLLKLAKTYDWRSLPIGRLVGEIGLALVGTPYVANTLDTSDDVETCVVSLTRLDCVTFYEACLGLARSLKLHTVRSVDQAQQAILAQVRLMRYRGGRQDGYLSRLHYTSDWLYDNDRRGIVELFTKDLPGAEPLDKHIDFMSTHPASYRQLRAHPEWVPKLTEMENEWSARRVPYLPKEVVPMDESLLDTGDILGIVTNLKGLDTSHTGICYRDADGALRILHASSAHKKVELGPRLSVYLDSIKSDIGILVAAPREPH